MAFSRLLSSKHLGEFEQSSEMSESEPLSYCNDGFVLGYSGSLRKKPLPSQPRKKTQVRVMVNWWKKGLNKGLLGDDGG